MNRIAVLVASIWVVVAGTLAGVGAVGATQIDSVGGHSAAMADGGPTLAQTANTTANTTTTETTNATAENETEDGNESDSFAPGAQLAGVIGVQQAEFQGEIQNRAFGHSVAAARSNGSKAQLVASNTEQLRERLRTLENETTALNESYQNGSILTGTYHARLARLTAQIRMTERLVNQTEATATQLPPAAKAANGVNVTDLDELRMEAHSMAGPAVSAIAKQIGGPEVGHPLGKERGPPGDDPGKGQGEEGDNGHSKGPSDDAGPRNQGTPGNETESAGPKNNSTMGPSDGTGHGNGPPENPGGEANESAADGQDSIGVPAGDLPTSLRPSG